MAKGAIVETTLSKNSFVSQIFLVEKKERGQRPVINLKSLNTFVRTEHFKMEGLHILPDLIQAQDCMIKMDPKDAYLQVPIHREHQHLLQFQWNRKIFQFQWLLFGLTSALSFLEGDEACSGNPEPHGHLTDHIPRQYLDITSSERGVDPNHNINLSNARSTGSGDQPEKVSVNPPTENGILGVPSGCNNIALDIPSRKAEESTTISTTPSLRTECFSERPGEVCWQDLSLAESKMASPSSLQCNTVFDKFCDADGSVPTRWSRDKVQCHTKLTREAENNLTWWSSLDRKIPLQSPLTPRIPIMTIELDASNMGWGARQGEQQTGGDGPKRKPYTI